MKRTPWNWLPESPSCFVLFRLLIAYPRTFLEPKCALLPRRPCEYEVAFGTFHSRCYRKRPQGGSTSCWPSWVNWATRAQAKGPFLGCGLEWNVPGKNSLGLVSGELFLLSLHITGRSQALPRPLCWGCCHRQLGRLPGKGLLVGIPAQRDSDLVMTVQSSSWTQGPRALHDLGLPELKGLPGSGDWGLMVRGPGTPRGGWLPSWHLLPCSLSSMRVQLWDTRLLRLQGCDTRLGFWGLTEIW